MGSQIVTTSERNRGGGELVGMRGQFTATGKAHAKDHSEAMRAYLEPHIQKYCDMLLRGVDKGDRTAMRAFPEIMGVLGAKNDLVQALVVAVGAQSPEHLKSAASAALDAETVDEETAYAQALDFVQDYRRRMGLSPLVEVDERAGEVPGV